MSQYFPKSYELFGEDIIVKVYLSNYSTKNRYQKHFAYDTSSLVLKPNLPNLKTEIDKLDVDKLAAVLFCLSKLGDVVKNDVVKKSCLW